MRKTSRHSGKRTATELRKMARRGEVKTDWKAAAKKPLPLGRDPDDAMEEIDWLTTELPQPRRKAHMTLRLDKDMLDWVPRAGARLSNEDQRHPAAVLRAAYAVTR
jgi:hypothetical protein